MCSAPKQGQALPAGVDLEKKTVITGRTAEVVASATGDVRFFAAPGTWTLRALSPAGNGDTSVAPSGAGIHEIDVRSPDLPRSRSGPEG
jgi:hypothetical protein